MSFNAAFDMPTTPEEAVEVLRAWSTGAMTYSVEKVKRVLELVERRQGSLQAKIDSLMLEYCPGEMTREQLDNWAAHQKVHDGSVPTEKIFGYTELTAILRNMVDAPLLECKKAAMVADGNLDKAIAWLTTPHRAASTNTNGMRVWKLKPSPSSDEAQQS